MLHSFVRLEQAARRRQDTDKRLVNWWLLTFLLSWLTLGIMSLVVLYQRLKRRDAHFERINSFLDAAIQCTREYAQITGKMDAGVQHQLDSLTQHLDQAQRTLMRPAGAIAWVIGLSGAGFMTSFAPEPISGFLALAFAM